MKRRENNIKQHFETLHDKAICPTNSICNCNKWHLLKKQDFHMFPQNVIDVLYHCWWFPIKFFSKLFVFRLRVTKPKFTLGLMHLFSRTIWNGPAELIDRSTDIQLSATDCSLKICFFYVYSCIERGIQLLSFSIQLGLQDHNISQANILLLTPPGSCGECPKEVAAPAPGC